MSQPVIATIPSPGLPDLPIAYNIGNAHLTWHVGRLSLEGEQVVIHSQTSETYRFRLADVRRCRTFSILASLRLTFPIGAIGSHLLNLSFGEPGDEFLQHFPAATIAGYNKAQQTEAVLTADVLAWQKYLRGNSGRRRFSNITSVYRLGLAAAGLTVAIVVIITIAAHA